MGIPVPFNDIRHERNGPVAWLTLNRPADMNSITSAMASELTEALGQIAADATVRAVVLTGMGGKAFCAGADLKALVTDMERGTPPGEPDFLDRVTAMFGVLRSLPKPVIAAVNGLALAGGLELVMACDLVIAADTARLGDAHSNFGVFPGAGGAALLPRKVGINRAKYLLFTGDMLSAAEMKSYGLVNEVVPAAELIARTQALAERLAEKSPLVLRHMKETANRAQDQTEAAGLRDELLTLRNHLRSNDLREGIAAFNEKRKPCFTGT